MTNRSITVEGRPVAYRADVDGFELDGADGSPGAIVYVTSYVRTDLTAEEQEARPVVFAFNGGPGSSSVWTHLGLGPRRIAEADSLSPRMSPPFHLVDNPDTPLDAADLVFIDPIGTGYSRLRDPEAAPNFFGLEEDAQATLDVIQQWVRRRGRHQSPRFLLGESYGTLRAARMARIAHGGPFRRGLTRACTIAGVITIGTHLVFGEQAWAGDMQAALELETMVRSARWHGCSDGTDDAAVAQFARETLLPALAWGRALPQAERSQIAQRMAAMTGLDVEFILHRDLQVRVDEFAKALLPGRHLGAYDSRFTLSSAGAGTDPVADDPAMAQYAPQFTGLIESYLRDELGVDIDDEYRAIDFRHTLEGWNYDGQPTPQSPAFPELQEALRRDPRFEVLLGCGEFDLVTTAAASTFAINRVAYDTERVHLRIYPSGHMPYLGRASRLQLAADLREFLGRVRHRQPSEQRDGR